MSTSGTSTIQQLGNDLYQQKTQLLIKSSFFLLCYKYSLGFLPGLAQYHVCNITHQTIAIVFVQTAINEVIITRVVDGVLQKRNGRERNVELFTSQTIVSIVIASLLRNQSLILHPTYFHDLRAVVYVQGVYTLILRLFFRFCAPYVCRLLGDTLPSYRADVKSKGKEKKTEEHPHQGEDPQSTESESDGLSGYNSEELEKYEKQKHTDIFL